MLELDEIKNRSCVVYVRRSDQSKNNQEKSISEQIQLCVDLASELKLRIVKTYIEEEKGHGTRAEFQKLKQDVNSGTIKPQFLVCWRRDRISRQFIDDFRADVQPLQDAGLLFLPTDTRKPQRFYSSQRDTLGRFKDILETNKSAEYSVNLAETIATRSYSKASLGNLYSKDCFGWITERTFQGSKVVDRKRVPHPEDSIIVQEMFNTFLNTKSLSSLVPVLEKSKRYPKKKCDACVQRQKEQGKKRIGLSVDQSIEQCTNKYNVIKENGEVEEVFCNSKDFTNVKTKTPDIRAILRNQTHCGDYSYYKSNTGKYRQRVNNKVIDVEEHRENNISITKRQNINPVNADVYIEGTHEGIIDRDTFTKAQEILDNNKSSSGQNRKTTGYYSGLITCGSCGSNMTYRSTQGHAKYVCDSSIPRKDLQTGCTGGTKQIREQDLEKIVLDNIASQLSTPLYWYIAIREMQEVIAQRELSNAGNNLEEEILAIKEKVASLDKVIAGIDYSDPVESLKSDAIFQQKLKLDGELKSAITKKSKQDDEPLYELLEKTREENWDIINSSFLSQDLIVWGNEFQPPDKTRMVDIDELLLGIKPNVAVLCSSPEGTVMPVAENLDIVLDLLSGSVQERLLLAYCLCSGEKEENSDKKRKNISVILAYCFEQELNKLEWSAVEEKLYYQADIHNIVKDITLEFTPVDNIGSLQNPELAYKMKHPHNKNVVSSYDLRLLYDGMGDQYVRSRSYWFHIKG